MMKSPALDGAAAVRLDAPRDSDPPYAWVMLPLAILMQLGTSPGQTFGVSLFNEPIRESLGLSHTQLTGAYMLASALAAVPLMWIGRRMDRVGLRRVSLGLVAVVAVACFAISRVQGIVGLTLAFFLLRAFGQGGLSMASGNTLGMWFSRRLGLASGVAGIGAACGVAVTPFVYNALIQRFGWRDAYAVIGGVLLFALLPLMWLSYRNNLAAMTEAPATAGRSVTSRSFTLKQAMRTPAYWAATACAALTGLICTAVFFNLDPMLARNGLTSGHAAAAFPWIASAMALMQLNGGMLADRVPLRVLMAVAMALLGGGVLMMGEATTPLVVYAGGVMLGAGQGLMAVSGNTLWPRYFGRRELGSIRSSVWTITVAACSVGPFIMGLTLDLTGTYEPSLWLFVALAAITSAATFVWGGPPEVVVEAPEACASAALAAS
jgi:MFS family permease